MSRIANYASQQVLNTYINQVRNRIQDTQVQLSSEKISQDYAGISRDSQRLVGYEVDVQMLNNFMRSNEMQDVFLKTAGTALNSIETTITDFRQVITKLGTRTPTDETAINGLQLNAFNYMLSMQSYLNTEVNGRYLFSGNQTRTAPIDLGLGTFEEFQAKYDGVNMSYPTTRAAHLEDFDLDSDGNGRTNWLTFTQDKDGDATTAGVSTITANTAQFANVTVGSHITVTGTASNNGTYEVAAVSADGKTIDINTKMLTDLTASTTAVLTNSNGATPLTSADFTNLTFNRAAGTIVAASADTLNALQVGQSFVVTGAGANNGTYMVETNDGTTLKIKEAKLTDEGTLPTAVTVPAGPFDMTFTNAPETIDSGVAGTFSNLAPGMKVTFAGTASNNVTYTVDTVVGGGQSITVKETVTAEVGAGANDTFTATTATPTLDLVAQNFTFTQNATAFDTIDSGAAGTFSALKVGMQVTVGGTVNNNGTFTVMSVDSTGQTISVQETLFTEAATGDETLLAAMADGTVTSNNYYQGDTFTHTHRVSETRDFTLDLNGVDPAFEKAFRAMALIAQGKFGTAGGLEQSANSHRVTDALDLIDLSLRFNDPSNPQYENEFTNSIEQAFGELGYQRSMISTANDEHTRLIGFFESRVADLENIDPLDAITRLLDDQKALEASYQAMANIRGLSLHNYLT